MGDATPLKESNRSNSSTATSQRDGKAKQKVSFDSPDKVDAAVGSLLSANSSLSPALSPLVPTSPLGESPSGKGSGGRRGRRRNKKRQSICMPSEVEDIKVRVCA